MERLWWLNDESQQILNRGYLLKGETPQKAIERIATAACKRLYKPELKEAFIEMIERGWMSDFYAAIRLYGGLDNFKQIIKELPYLPDRDMDFVCKIFELKKDELSCYTRKQLRMKHLGS